MAAYKPHFLKLSHWKEPALGSLVIAALSALGFIFGNASSGVPLWFSTGIAYLVSLLIWVSNQEASCYFDTHLPWEKNPQKRLVSMLIGNAALGFIIILTVIWLASYFFDIPLSREVLVSSILFGLLITLCINVYYIFRYFLETWKGKFKESEELKTLKLRDEIQGLRGQLAPHFLFNSLTALDQLIHENPLLASNYLEQLANCYRYMLRYQDETEIPVAEELQFMEDYLALLSVRYGPGLQVSWQKGPGYEGTLPFLAGQRLIENVVNHNLISKNLPLEVFITLTPHFLEVRNRLRPTTHPKGSGEGVGLKNLKRHYELRKSDQPIIQNSGKWFSVQLPILHK
jgi:two-component system, LytTR family, sensor kinase